MIRFTYLKQHDKILCKTATNQFKFNVFGKFNSVMNNGPVIIAEIRERRTNAHIYLTGTGKI